MRAALVLLGLLASGADGFVAPVQALRRKSGNALVVRAQETDVAEGSKRRPRDWLIPLGFFAATTGIVGGGTYFLLGDTAAVYTSLVSGGGIPLWYYVSEGLTLRAKLRERIAPEVPAARRLERRGLVSQITHCLELDSSVLSQQYLVVSGLQKSGKTTAVKMACANRTGVAYVTMEPEMTLLRPALASTLGLDPTSRAAEIGSRIRAVHKGGGDDRIVVVADVSSKTPANTVQNVGNEMKILVEYGAGDVAGVIVLSNSTSVFALTNGVRQVQLVVDALTEEEANAYFDRYGVLNSDEEDRALRRRIVQDDTAIIGILEKYAEIYEGTTGDAAAKRAAAEAMFDERAVEADTDVEKLLKFGRGVEKGTEFDVSEMRKLVKRLLDAPTPTDGVFDRGLDLPNAADVAPVLKKYPALRYNKATSRYYWYEPRHRRAAERLQRAKSPHLRPWSFPRLFGSSYFEVDFVNRL